MEKQLILIVNFKGQYSMIIARRVREMSVYCEIVGYKEALKKAKELKPSGIIFSGSPNSVLDKNAPKIEKEIFGLNIPILGICYGAQLIADCFDGKVVKGEHGEFGKTKTNFNLNSKLFKNTKEVSDSLMSHTDKIESLPSNFKIIANSKLTKIAAFEDEERKIFATQFHPEVLDTENGTQIFYNFLFNICGCEKNWQLKSYLKTTIEEIKKTVGQKKVLLALSGGVDSCVVAAILNRAIGKNLTAVFVDHGFLRKDEEKEISNYFKGWDFNFIAVDAKDIFLEKIKGIVEPEEKRKIVGETFIEVFEQEAKKIGKIDFFAQGTIYPDIIESGEKNDQKATIKSHHNVGGLPEKMNFKKILEPLKFLFKDEVRKIGESLNLPDFLVKRQPFPGPGLCIRILGEVTKEKLEILKKADFVFRREIEKLPEKPDQYFAVLTNVKSVGVMGDSRSYCYVLALRAVKTTDFMTAQAFDFSISQLMDISKKIVNEVKEINRVVYDVTTKPPATIEFE